MAEKLRDLSQPIDVPLLDATVAAFYGTGSKEERTAADQILRELQNNPDMWLQVVHILQNSQNLNTKFFALQVLESVIKYRWNALPVEQRDGIKNYISDVIVQLSSNELSFRRERLYVNKLNIILVQVAALQFGDFYDVQYVKMYTIFMMQLQTILPPGTNIPDAYANGSSEEQSHIRVLESTPENRAALLLGLEYLIGISYVDDTEVFKVCLDYWNILVLDLFEAHHNMDNPAATASMMGLQQNSEELFVYWYFWLSCTKHGYIVDITEFFLCYNIIYAFLSMVTTMGLELELSIQIRKKYEYEVVGMQGILPDGWQDKYINMKCEHTEILFSGCLKCKTPLVPGIADGLGSPLLQRRQLYSGPLSKLRMLMICRMAKPEEIMRETLIYLSHLDHEDTEQQENRFLVMVIRDLLNLCEITKGKDNKAVIASNIMYVVGQYPRFLRAHWKFLKTVVNKLFEFMHETHPGVQDMACDTFLKIVQKCKRKFVITQVGENEPFVSELLSNLPSTVADLEPHQIHTFYESVGQMIQAESDPTKRDEYLKRLMDLPNQKWAEIIGQASQSVAILKDQDIIRTVLNILQTNTSVASSLGTYFFPQISLIFLDMLTVYRMYSELISSTISEGGPFASRTSYVKLLRSVKRETLKLIETFLDKAEDQPHIGKQFVPPMMDPVLGDYARNVPDARESEVLSLFATIINNRYKGVMMEDVPRIFEAVFQCTLEMITKNFEDYPEHRLKFFSLLRAIGTHCFQALIQLSSQQLKLVMDSIIWAFRHTERNIAETGLSLLLELLKNFQISEFCNQFYRTYYLTIEQEIFAVLTDTFHKPGFKLHVLVLQHLFCLVDSGSLTEPLWDAATVPYPYPNNTVFVRDYTIKLLGSSFPNMTAAEVTQFVDGLFESRNDLPTFKNHIRDFLVQSKEFSAQDNKDLYAEEAAAQRERERQRMLSIPGLIAPSELQDEMVDS
ncbi:putative Exportin-1 [Cocos nucifera]|uniref:Exportin-1 n=1 Tax=Cocos nucifera TaxID=13894 RepID=A0A8K0IRA7_COCNU|nr:putative Exportin-1 [Cocos nucifera]